MRSVYNAIVNVQRWSPGYIIGSPTVEYSLLSLSIALFKMRSTHLELAFLLRSVIARRQSSNIILVLASRRGH